MGDTDVIGILSIVFAFFFAPLGFVLGIAGIIHNRGQGTSVALPVIGLILSLLPLLLLILLFTGIFGLTAFASI